MAIHCFPNGNGRHARLAADLVALAVDCPRPSWGTSLAHDPDRLRATYITALHQADRGDIVPLIAFARS